MSTQLELGFAYTEKTSEFSLCPMSGAKLGTRKAGPSLSSSVPAASAPPWAAASSLGIVRLIPSRETKTGQGVPASAGHIKGDFIQ